MTTNPQLNRNVTLDEIAKHVRLTADALFEGDQDGANDNILELFDLLFPEDGATVEAASTQDVEQHGPEYQQGLTAFREKWEQNGKPGTEELPTIPPADYLILQDDDLSRTDRTESETMELLHEVQNQILDGEREPAAFLEAMELMYRISRQYTAASEQAAQRAEQAEARLVQLMQQNQHLLGLLSLISKGADQCTPTYTN